MAQCPCATNTPIEAPHFSEPLEPQRDHRLRESLDTQYWAAIYSMEITSSSCLSEVESLLNCPSKIALVRGLQGSEAQAFIDFLDQVS